MTCVEVHQRCWGFIGEGPIYINSYFSIHIFPTQEGDYSLSLYIFFSFWWIYNSSLQFLIKPRSLEYMLNVGLNTHTHTHLINIQSNQIFGALQSTVIKSLTSTLGPILWGSVGGHTWSYQLYLIPFCNDSRKIASPICVITQRQWSNRNWGSLELLIKAKSIHDIPNVGLDTHSHSIHIQSIWGITIGVKEPNPN